MQAGFDNAELGSWCRRWLGAEPTAVLFEVARVAVVLGLRLEDGRAVVVKARPPAHRLSACVAVQRALLAAGFPCPEPLTGPASLGALAATAEAFVPGGEQLDRGDGSPRLFAAALAELVGLAPPAASIPSLEPPPPWVRWEHDQPGTWPMPDDRDTDLNADRGPAWLEDAARRVRRRLARCRRPHVVGHADWESQNLRWVEGRLHVVHDWDSVVSQPEVVLAGAAAAVFTASGAPLSEATVAESAAFLTAYEDARGTPWSDEDRELCWAAGLWVRAYNAKKASLDSEGGTVLDRLADEVAERLRLAGA